MVLGGVIPVWTSAALVDFPTPLFLVWWLMGLCGSPSSSSFLFFGLWVMGSVIKGRHRWWSLAWETSLTFLLAWG